MTEELAKAQNTISQIRRNNKNLKQQLAEAKEAKNAILRHRCWICRLFGCEPKEPK